MLPKEVKQEMLNCIVNDGYGMRGKSKWVSEAIATLITLPNYEEYVMIANEVSCLTEPDVIQLSSELREKLDKAVIDVKTNYPLMDGVQSCIIRTSILQRILRKY